MFFSYRMARNMQQIELERDELELTLKSKVMEIEKLKDKCFEMEEEHLILQVFFNFCIFQIILYALNG